ncbi:MAG: MoxR family ATPase [Bacteroidota bacterium]
MQNKPVTLERLGGEALFSKIAAVRQEVSKVVIGQEQMVSRLLIGLFTNGHILLEGVPGLAKTLTVRTLAETLAVDFSRIQFTPDMLPADVVGTEIFHQAKGTFEIKKGPVFAHLILADEINRAPAKVQSALLEAMQEKQVSIGGSTFPLDEPFLVLATQNPIDQEGTYALPEAQIDRFMLRVKVGYPDFKEEKEIMRRMARTGQLPSVKPILHKEDILEIRKLIDQIQVAEQLEDYIVHLVLASRNPSQYGLQELADYIEFGASPRATMALHLGARAHAFLEGRSYALPEDVKAIAQEVLGHRVILNFEAEAEEVTTEQCVAALLQHVPI